MSVISDLDPVARVVESLFIQAWKLFEQSKFDKVSACLLLSIYSSTDTYISQANTLSKNLLLEPRIGRLHRAGLHVILARSPDDYLWHADEAVRMYENMYTDDMPPPTPEQAENIKELLENAKSIQARARITKRRVRRVSQQRRKRGSGSSDRYPPRASNGERFCTTMKTTKMTSRRLRKAGQM